MTTSMDSFVLWVPRVLGIAAAVFLGLFALDAFAAGRPIGEALPDFAMHLLPSVLVLLAVVAAWRRPWIGALTFLVLALGYAAMVPRRPDWILVISGPLLVVALLFFWSWRSR